MKKIICALNSLNAKFFLESFAKNVCSAVVIIKFINLTEFLIDNK